MDENDEKLNSKLGSENSKSEIDNVRNTYSDQDIGSKNTDDAPSVQKVLDEIAELEKEIKYEQKKEKKSGDIPQFSESKSQPQSQVQIPSSHFRNTSLNQSISRPLRTYRRAQRVRRRYGAGGVSKGVGKKAAKRGAAAVGRVILSNPYVLAAIGIALVMLLGFILIVAAIVNACKIDPLSLLTDPPNLVLAAIGHGTGLCNNANEYTYEVRVPKNPTGIITKISGPYRIANTDNLEYKINVSYDPSISGAIYKDSLSQLSLFSIPLFDNLLVSASGYNERRLGDDGRYYIRWGFEDNLCDRTLNCDFTLILSPNVQDFYSLNALYVSDVYAPVEIIGTLPAGNSTSGGTSGGGTGGGGTGGGEVPSTPEVKTCESRAENDLYYGADCAPTDRTCNGRWTTLMAKTKTSVENYISQGKLDGAAGTGYNFGDPLCSFTAAKLDKVIDGLVASGVESSQERGEFWKDIAYCEGTPNSFGNQPAPMGPAGHFQMGIGQPIVFKDWQPDKPNRGDVTWQRQIENAIKYNNEVLIPANADFEYWGAARCLCWYPEYAVKRYCLDIVRDGLQRNPTACGNDKCAERGKLGPAL